MSTISVLTSCEFEKLKSLVSKFYAETGSVVAHSLLENFEENVKRFSMIMPRDYARVLNVIEQAEREGRIAEEMIMESLNG